MSEVEILHRTTNPYHDLASFSGTNSPSQEHQRLIHQTDSIKELSGRSKEMPPRPSMTKNWRRFCKSITLVTFFILSALSIFIASSLGASLQIAHASSILGSLSSSGLLKPADVKIVGLVFYGRKQFVEILDCYLQSNLASNGGWLDEVRFIVSTGDEKDLDYVFHLIAGVDGYEKVSVTDVKDQPRFETMWRQGTEPGTVFVKLDDDLVWIDDQAIPQVVNTLLAHPDRPVTVLGNLINSASLGWLRYSLGAVHSYLPELSRPNDPVPSSYGPGAWRASSLPKWQATHGFDTTASGNLAPEKFQKTHRWLPLQKNDTIWTPIENTAYDAFGPDWTDWRIAAQKHYSFLQDLELGQLEQYHFGKDGTWNLHGQRGNINLMAIWGDDIHNHGPFGDVDEQWLSEGLPKKLNRPCLVQTRSLSSHFAFRTQTKQLAYTDLLSRYRAYADEMVCKAEIGKREPGVTAF